MKPRFLPLSAALVCVSAFSALAAPISITNPGFETDLSGPGGWSDAVPTGWADPQGGDNTNFIENIAGFASEGSMHLGFEGNDFGLVYQDLSTAWAPNSTYTLTVGVGNRSGGTGAGLGRFSLTSSFDGLPAAGPLNGPYSLYTPSGFFTDLDTSTVANVPGSFADAVFTFSTGAVAPAGNIRIAVQSLNGTRIHVDNFRLDVVPEPASMGLLGLGAAVMMRRRRRA